MVVKCRPIENDVTLLVTTILQNRKPLFSNPAIAREAIDTLYRVQDQHPFFLFGFVIMPDHCHLLIRVPSPGKISTVMNRWKMGVAHSIGLGPIWQSRFDARTVHDVSEALRYIHNNPAKAGLVEIPDNYPWSSASGKWDVQPIDNWY
ncbi:MAG: transposase [Candidatus Peregrinibacteria bacterium]